MRTGLSECDITPRKWLRPTGLPATNKGSQFSSHFFHDMDAPLLEPAVIRRKSTSLLHESKLQKICQPNVWNVQIKIKKIEVCGILASAGTSCLERHWGGGSLCPVLLYSQCLLPKFGTSEEGGHKRHKQKLLF